MRTIRLSRPGLYALVDDEDYDDLVTYKWSVKPSKDGSHVYAVTNIKIPGCGWCQQKMSTMIMEPPADHVVIFKNHWGLDCRRRNLLVLPQNKVQRFHRVRRDCATEAKGISRESSGRWGVRIMVDGRPAHVGTFDTQEEAMVAYDNAIRRHFGNQAAMHNPGPGGCSAKRGTPRPVPPPVRPRRSFQLAGGPGQESPFAPESFIYG
jgi:hypothetical protein